MKVTDQMGRELEIKKPVRRIVSLVPSQTEFLFHIGLEDEVVGITKFCVRPEKWYRNKTRVGGTKNAKFSRVAELEPDLIIGNKEENDQKNIDDLSQIAPVWMSDVSNLSEGLDMMRQLGRILGKETQTEDLVQRIKSEFDSIQPHITKNALYLIWKNPCMLAGTGTFISDMLQKCGFLNQADGERYPEMKEEYADIDLILLSSEPYPFKESDVDELQLKFPKAKIILVDGEMFSWYGSRLLKAPKYFQELITSIE